MFEAFPIQNRPLLAGKNEPHAPNLWAFVLPLTLEMRRSWTTPLRIRTPKYPQGRLVRLLPAAICCDGPARTAIVGSAHMANTQGFCSRCNACKKTSELCESPCQLNRGLTTRVFCLRLQRWCNSILFKRHSKPDCHRSQRDVYLSSTERRSSQGLGQKGGVYGSPRSGWITVNRHGAWKTSYPLWRDTFRPRGLKSCGKTVKRSRGIPVLLTS